MQEQAQNFRIPSVENESWICLFWSSCKAIGLVLPTKLNFSVRDQIEESY